VSDEKDDERLIQAILASGVKIPPMPTLVLEVMALARDDDAGPRDFATLVSRDPALAGALFRVVGSPVLGLRTKVESLEKAITVLGLRTTVAVVRSEGLRGMLNDPEQVSVMNSLWQHMNGIADMALGLVRTLRLKGVREDDAFLAGIFHDCGVMVLCRRDKGYARAFHEELFWPDLLALDASFKTNHAVVGQMVARNWQLPPDVVLAVRHHHESNLARLPESVRKLVALIQFTSHLKVVRAGGDDSQWGEVWRQCAETLFGEPELEFSSIEGRLFT